MTEPRAETPQNAGKTRNLDVGLNVAVAVLLVATLSLAAWFGYSVWQNRQREELTNAPTRVVKSLQEQVRQSPNDVILRVRLGEALGAAGKYPQAIEQFNAALKIDPKHIGAHLDLGMVAMLTENDDEAETYFKKVIELTEEAQFSKVDERRENALYNLGLLTLRQQKYDEAAGYFKGALRIRKDASDTYLNLARALRGLEDYDSAITNLEFAIAFDPGFAEAHYTMGQVYEQKGDKVNASYHYFQAARLAPDAEPPQEALAAFGTSTEWSARAASELEAGELDQALESALIARNLDPESVAAVKVHAQVLLARGDVEDALEVYLKGREQISAENGDIATGISGIEADHPAAALAVYQRALKANPDDEYLKTAVERMEKES